MTLQRMLTVCVAATQATATIHAQTKGSKRGIAYDLPSTADIDAIAPLANRLAVYSSSALPSATDRLSRVKY